MPSVISTGQLAATASSILGSFAGPKLVSLILFNTSATLTETIVITLVRSDATSFTVVRGVLAPKESCYVMDIPVDAGDTLKGSTTDATTVDYTVTPASVKPPQFLDANGALRQVNTGVSGNQTVSGVQTAAGFVNTGVRTEGLGASTVALGTNSGTAAVLPAATGGVYPTTAADDTVGVRVHASDQVTGRTLLIGNGVANKILKVYAPSGGVINGGSADAAFSSASGKGVIITCLSGSGNTWLAW